jgi:hypothetical protein
VSFDIDTRPLLGAELHKYLVAPRIVLVTTVFTGHVVQRGADTRHFFERLGEPLERGSYLQSH